MSEDAAARAERDAMEREHNRYFCERATIAEIDARHARLEAANARMRAALAAGDGVAFRAANAMFDQAFWSRPATEQGDAAAEQGDAAAEQGDAAACPAPAGAARQADDERRDMESAYNRYYAEVGTLPEQGARLAGMKDAYDAMRAARAADDPVAFEAASARYDQAFWSHPAAMGFREPPAAEQGDADGL